MGSFGKIWEDLGRFGKIWEDMGIFEKTWEDLGSTFEAIKDNLKNVGSTYVNIFSQTIFQNIKNFLKKSWVTMFSFDLCRAKITYY